MYPLKFEPILKQTLWGGDKIIPFKHLDSTKENVGESWEISGVENNESVVANGPDKGLTLTDMVRKYREELVGEANYLRFGNTFPLLIKFIDAKQDLSIQVHPSDELAKKRHNSMGKTEMWYVIAADKGSRLRSGFSEQITPKEYKERVQNNTITDVLQEYEIHSGDVFFLPAGRVHSIGPGCFICEIQETSDITYRIYDFGRTDSQGRQRQLHIEEARDVISYAVSEPDTTPVVKDNEPQTVVSCRHFTTSVYRLTESITCDYSDLDSFVILICTSGTCDVRCDGASVTLRAGQTVLVSAAAEHVVLEPSASATGQDLPPLRRPTITSQPESLRFSAWAWPWEP